MSWTVADVMTRDVVAVGLDEDFKSCARLLRVHEISALPVVDHDRRLVGIVSEADLLAMERERDAKPSLLGIHWDEDGRASGRTAGDVMTHPAISISPDASIPQAARLMYREAVKHLPVVDPTGAMVGIVSRADLLKTFTRSDESIERDIVDDVIRKALALDDRKVGVDVLNGFVRLSGELESKSLCKILIGMAKRVEGTVGVESMLTYRFDDSRLQMKEPAGSLQLAADER